MHTGTAASMEQGSVAGAPLGRPQLDASLRQNGGGMGVNNEPANRANQAADAAPPKVHMSESLIYIDMCVVLFLPFIPSAFISFKFS